MEFNDVFEQYLSRIKKMKDQLNDLTEEATKNALIMPFFSMLGYDVFDTTEFMPEFVCDVGTKKGEKIDYALLKDGEPVILIEAKRAGMKLQKQQQSQLYRYFTANRCRLAILTNGVTYQVFSDINTPNIMDDEPFLSFNLLEDDPMIYRSAVRQFSKENFDTKNILSKAVFQKYEKVVIKTLTQDLLEPSDEIVKYFLSRPEIKTGNRITSQMIEKHRGTTKKAMQKVFGVVIKEPTFNERSVDTVTPEVNVSVEEVTQPQAEEQSPALSLIPPPERIKEILKDYRLQEEDNPAFLRLHVYDTNNRKLGIVKITKPDMKITFKVPGNPNVTEISNPEEIKNLL